MMELMDTNADQECHNSNTRTDQQGQGEKVRQQQAYKDSQFHLLHSTSKNCVTIALAEKAVGGIEPNA
jgi:hypothetical protein